MKLINSIALSLAAASTVFFIGCAADTAKVVPESELGYGSVSLDDDSVEGTPGTHYSTVAPGKSKRIKRAFQDAPPMIPHSVDGMLPIKQGNNQCITCHVDSAPYDKTIPSVPVSHFTNFRPSSKAVGGINTSSESLKNVSIKKINHLYKGRFNCSQCHAPQSTAANFRGSKFQPEFTSKGGEFKSSWNESKFMEDIDTTK